MALDLRQFDPDSVGSTFVNIAVGLRAVPKTPNRSGRLNCAAEDQDLDELLKDHAVGDAGTVAAKRMIHFPVGEQDTELLEDGLDDVWLDGGHTP